MTNKDVRRSWLGCTPDRKAETYEAEGYPVFRCGVFCSVSAPKGVHDSVDRSLDGCFIATSVYGDSQAYPVERLRGFRGELNQGFLGSQLVNLYYSGLGRGIGLLLDRVPQFKPLIRKGLDWFVLMV